MKKQGFTIIELMVVVVIMGILAAIAVPKLFGMIDKAKASELSFSAGTYAKLQETYIYEQHKAGDWIAIGYKSPAGNASGIASTSNYSYDADQSTYNWTAESIVGLNRCPKGQKWFVNFSLDVGHSQIKFWASSDDVAKCSDPLTPNFKLLSNSATPITSPGRTE